MKTPRDILLARHQAALPKLDVIRRSVVVELNNQETKEQSFPASLVASLLGCSNKIWLELVWPCRRLWSGLATVWIALFLVNVAQRDNLSSVTGKPVLTQSVMMSWQVQQRWMNELLADRSGPVSADRSRNVAPKPRTENCEITIV